MFFFFILWNGGLVFGIDYGIIWYREDLYKVICVFEILGLIRYLEWYLKWIYYLVSFFVVWWKGKKGKCERY